MAKIQIIPSPMFDQQLRNGSVESATKQLFQRVAFKSAAISTEVGNLLAKIFNESDVAQALMGNGVDLPAHFGLTDTQASSLVKGMEQLIRSSVQIRVSPNNPKIVINILAVSSQWEEYISLPGGEYISKPSGITIPVARWLLLDPNIDIGQAAYSIIFDGSKVDLQNSRSGRAIMVELGKVAGANTPYVLPSIVNKKAGENFIEYTLGQKNVAQQVMQIVMKNI